MQQLDHKKTIPEITWEELANYSTLEIAVNRVVEAYDFRHHPYIIWMQASGTSREEFRQSQLSFRFAVECFSQPLAAVLAKIPQLEKRLPIFENIAEEHGSGSILRSHKYTFQQYLQALGSSALELNTPCTTSVLAFNQSILAYCITQQPESGSAMLGMIEYLYIGISANIAQTLQHRSWTTPGSQSHYAVHERLDTEHSRDLLMLATPAWDESRSRTQVAQGLVLGAHYFWTLYNDLLPCF
jgi:pyrroloquinoline-quinone synthase